MSTTTPTSTSPYSLPLPMSGSGISVTRIAHLEVHRRTTLDEPPLSCLNPPSGVWHEFYGSPQWQWRPSMPHATLLSMGLEYFHKRFVGGTLRLVHVESRPIRARLRMSLPADRRGLLTQQFWRRRFWSRIEPEQLVEDEKLLLGGYPPQPVYTCKVEGRWMRFNKLRKFIRPSNRIAVLSEAMLITPSTSLADMPSEEADEAVNRWPLATLPETVPLPRVDVRKLRILLAGGKSAPCIRVELGSHHYWHCSLMALVTSSPFWAAMLRHRQPEVDDNTNRVSLPPEHYSPVVIDIVVGEAHHHSPHDLTHLDAAELTQLYHVADQWFMMQLKTRVALAMACNDDEDLSPNPRGTLTRIKIKPNPVADWRTRYPNHWLYKRDLNLARCANEVRIVGNCTVDGCEDCIRGLFFPDQESLVDIQAVRDVKFIIGSNDERDYWTMG